MNIKLFVPLFVCFLLPWFMMAQGPQHSSDPGHIVDGFTAHIDAASPQKIFLHLDKQSYRAGESIWFKGYLVHGVTHMPEQSGANVYVELWDVQGELVRELILKPDSGTFHGRIFLDQDIADGNYRLRAYTDWMLNQGESFLFQQHLYVSNPQFANVIDNDTRRFNRQFNELLETMRSDMQVSLFPEGGRLVNGVESRVAVKVADASGRGVSARGEVRNGAGSVLATFSTNEKGFGLFAVAPSSQDLYTVDVRIAGQREITASFPEVAADGFVLRADMVDEEWLEVTISHASSGSESNRCVLLAHTRGQLVSFIPDIVVDGAEQLRIPLSSFPTGIAHLTLFSPGATPLAERLVFVNHHDQAYFDMRARALRAGEVTALHIDMLASNEKGTPLQGNFSVSVQYSQEVDRTYHDNIYSYLLLSGDLKGMVESPAYYFDFEQDDVEKAIDLLMMTHGWRRFEWESILAGQQPDMPFMPRFGLSIAGSVSDPDSKAPLGNADIAMEVVEDRSLAFQSRTDTQGIFQFDGVVVADSVLVEITAATPAGEISPDVTLMDPGRLGDAEALPVLHPDCMTRPQAITDRGSQWQRSRTAPEPGGRSVTPSAYGQADQVIYPDKDIYYTSILDLLREKSVGLSITAAGEITVRGPSSINFQAAPVYIVDGVESRGGFESLDVRDVDRVEIFRGGSSAVFGARGVNGALVAYTRKREFVEAPDTGNKFLVRGLHAPRQFMTHDDTTRALPGANETTTLHWVPQLFTGADGLDSFQFLPHVLSGHYRIVIQGVTNDGRVGFGVFFIEM